MPEPRKLRVFLCHASQDKPVVRELYQRLFAEGWIDPWLDISNLLPGQDWRLAIEDAVSAADNIIICISKGSVTKEGYIQKEMRYAQEISLEKPEGTIFLIPLKLDECETPRGLRFFQWTSYFGKEKEQGYQDLLKSLRLRLDEKIHKEDEEVFQLEAQERARLIEDEGARTEPPEFLQKHATEESELLSDGSQLHHQSGGSAPGPKKGVFKTNISIFTIETLSLIMLGLGSVYFRSFVNSGDNRLDSTGNLGVSLCSLSNLLAILAGTISLVKYFSRQNSNTRIGLLVSIFVFVLNCLVSVLVYFN